MGSEVAEPYEGVPVPLVRLDAATVELIRGSGDGHFTAVVAPLLVAFTLPTIAALVMADKLPLGVDDTWRSVVVALFVISTGFFLAGTLLATGTRSLVPGAVRAVLTYCGAGVLTAALVLLTLPIMKRTEDLALAPWIIGLAVLVLGCLIPIALRILRWKHDKTDIRVLRACHHDPITDERTGAEATTSTGRTGRLRPR